MIFKTTSDEREKKIRYEALAHFLFTLIGILILKGLIESLLNIRLLPAFVGEMFCIAFAASVYDFELLFRKALRFENFKPKFIVLSVVFAFVIVCSIIIYATEPFFIMHEGMFSPVFINILIDVILISDYTAFIVAYVKYKKLLKEQDNDDIIVGEITED